MSESTGFFSSIGRWFWRVGVRLGVLIDRSTESDEFNEAIIERGIRDSQDKAKQAHYANGQLAAQIALLKSQIRREESEASEIEAALKLAVQQNDEANGSHYAEMKANLDSDIADNKEQLKGLTETYEQNTKIIADSIREVQRFQREFESMKVKVRVGRSQESLAKMIAGSVTELQGIGNESAKAMDRMRTAAAQGQGQMTATLDLAKQVGSTVAMRQEARKAKGKALFAQYKQQMTKVETEVAATPVAEAKQEVRQKISAG
jgi:phage shock protein A